MKIKTIFAIMVFLSSSTQAQDDERLLQEWTKKNEAQLLDKYTIMKSKWFESSCLALAVQLDFNSVNACYLINSPHINAYVFNNGHVYISIEMMKRINNKHQWASILAHENAHIELNHYIKMLKKIKKPGLFFPKSKIKKIMKKHEKEADAWAEVRLKTYGFDSSQIYYFLQRVDKVVKNKSKLHLKPRNRVLKPKVAELIDSTIIVEISEIESGFN
jgi:hypothetical protein